MHNTILVLLSAITAAYCLVSTNPDGFTFFHPSLVKELTINTNQTGTLSTQTSYQDYWYFHVPEGTASIEYNLNNTGYGTDGCLSSISLYARGEYDGNPFFPCVKDAGENCFNDYDLSFSDDGRDSTELDHFMWGFLIPPTRVFVSIVSDGPCPYTFGVRAVPQTTCTNNSVVLVKSTNFEDFGCTSYQNVSSNGQTFSGTLTTDADVLTYRVVVPENVTRVWANLASTSAFVGLSATTGGACVVVYADAIDTDPLFNSTDGTYTYSVNRLQPYGYSSIYVSVFVHGSLSEIPADFNVTIGWTQCQYPMSGVGSRAMSYLDCTDKVEQIDISKDNSKTYQLAAYNSIDDFNYNAIHVYIPIPEKTSGHLEFTCNSTDAYSSTFLVFTSNAMASCNSASNQFRIGCSNGGGSVSNPKMTLISQDLYPGRYWTVAMCTRSASDVSVTLSVAGSLQLPPSPSPSVLPSPESETTSSESRSDSHRMFPSTLAIALAVLLLSM